MSVSSLPEWLQAKAVQKFLDGATPDDRAPALALNQFLAEVAEDTNPNVLHIASVTLDDLKEVTNLIEKARQAIEAENIAAKEAHKSDHERRVEQFHLDYAARNKISNLINVITSLASLVMGLAISPLLTIIFKHHLTALDKKLHPEDYQSKKEELPTPLYCEQGLPAETILPKAAKHHKLVQAGAPPPDDKIVRVQNAPYGLRDPKTNQTMYELLEQGKKVLLPDGKNVIYLKPPSAPCQKTTGYGAPTIK